MTPRLADRRFYRRLTIAEHRIVSARVRPGHPATVVDVSEGGALIETAKSLLPGTLVDLQFGTLQQQSAVRGRVLRCQVATLRADAVSYRAAIGFEYPIPTRERGRSCSSGVNASQDLVSRVAP